MTTALIITLFIIQLITIFVIVILNSKLSKFNDLEKRQNELVNEMDNAISVYLMEMREENDRLINELKKPVDSKNKARITSEVPIHTVTEQPVMKQMETLQNQPDSIKQEEQLTEIQPRKFVPVKQAVNAYNKQKNEPIEELEETTSIEAQLFSKEDNNETKQPTFEQQVVAHYRDGKSIEEIAKMMQRGKTEIELLVKFHA